MPRKRRVPKARIESTPPHLIELLETGELPTERGPSHWEAWCLRWEQHPQLRLRTLWEQRRADIMREWPRSHPGKRPWAWWLFDSEEPRRCLSDQDGTLAGVEPCLEWGVPRYWYSATPPQFESQVDYLDRHGLLSATERRRLPAEAAPGPT